MMPAQRTSSRSSRARRGRDNTSSSVSAASQGADREPGVAAALTILQREFETIMRQAGATELKQIMTATVAERSPGARPWAGRGDCDRHLACQRRERLIRPRALCMLRVALDVEPD